MTRLWPLLIYHDLHPRRSRRARVALHKIQIPEDATQPELLAVAGGSHATPSSKNHPSRNAGYVKIRGFKLRERP